MPGATLVAVVSYLESVAIGRVLARLRRTGPELDRARWRSHRETAVQRARGEECRGGERGREQRGGNLEDIGGHGGHVDHMSTATMRRMATKPAACRTTTAPTSRYP